MKLFDYEAVERPLLVQQRLPSYFAVTVRVYVAEWTRKPSVAETV
jgi:hypothetical protein